MNPGLRAAIAYIACFFLALLASSLVLGNPTTWAELPGSGGAWSGLAQFLMTGTLFLAPWYLIFGGPLVFYLYRRRGALRPHIVFLLGTLPFVVGALVLRSLSAAHFSDPFTQFLERTPLLLVLISGATVLVFWYLGGLSRRSHA